MSYQFHRIGVYTMLFIMWFLASAAVIAAAAEHFELI